MKSIKSLNACSTRTVAAVFRHEFPDFPVKAWRRPTSISRVHSGGSLSEVVYLLRGSIVRLRFVNGKVTARQVSNYGALLGEWELVG